MKDYDYIVKFPLGWRNYLRDELRKEFGAYQCSTSGTGAYRYYPPVVTNSIVGTIAANLPSKPEGITLWGTIYYTPHYPRMKNLFQSRQGDREALIYEFGMFAHESYHAVEQEITGKLKWFIKYLLRLIKTPNAWKHPMEKPAYAFQDRLTSLARESATVDKDVA